MAIDILYIFVTVGLYVAAIMAHIEGFTALHQGHKREAALLFTIGVLISTAAFFSGRYWWIHG
jgi:hypothetical protein